MLQCKLPIYQPTYQPTKLPIYQPTIQPTNQQIIPQTSNLHELPIGLSCERSPHARILTLPNGLFHELPIGLSWERSPHSRILTLSNALSKTCFISWSRWWTKRNNFPWASKWFELYKVATCKNINSTKCLFVNMLLFLGVANESNWTRQYFGRFWHTPFYSMHIWLVTSYWYLDKQKSYPLLG